MQITPLDDPVIRYLEDRVANPDPLEVPDPAILWATTSAHRTPGLHLSQITQDIYSELHKQDRRNWRIAMRGREEKPDPELLWLLGLAWEHVISWGVRQCFPEEENRIIHVGELELDGILMTPDRVDTVLEEVVEIKATWKSAANWPLDRMFLWLVQAKAYCKALGYTKARFLVFYVNGGYFKPPCENGMCPKAWRVEFTEQELEDNLAMIKNHAKAKGWL